MFNQRSIFNQQEVRVRRRELPPLPAWQDVLASAAIIPEENISSSVSSHAHAMSKATLFDLSCALA
jgi:hypothetical protein